LNTNVAYEHKSVFSEKRDNKNFFSTSTRFDYYRSPTKETKSPLPSPLSYQIKDTFGPTSPKANSQYSFGVGRDDMKRIYVDEIKKHGDKALPGPGKYEHKKTFGATPGVGQGGLAYSMASNLETDNQALGRSGKLPGPGSYNALNITGNVLINSKINTESKYSFSKANDRFAAPTKKVAAPSPDAYQP